MPLLDFSFSFRNGEVGGDKGFDAALAFRNSEAAASVLDGDSRKTSMIIHNAMPTIIVSGFVRRNDRAGPMAPVFRWASSIDEVSQTQDCIRIQVSRRDAFSVGRGGADNHSRPQKIGNLRRGWQRSVVNKNLLERRNGLN